MTARNNQKIICSTERGFMQQNQYHMQIFLQMAVNTFTRIYASQCNNTSGLLHIFGQQILLHLLHFFPQFNPVIHWQFFSMTS